MIAVLLIQWGLPLSNSKKNSQEKNSTRFLNKYSFSMKQVVLLRSVIFISDNCKRRSRVQLLDKKNDEKNISHYARETIH